VDNPVGAGFSYVTSKDHLTTSVTEIGLDLLTFLEQWYQDHQQYHVSAIPENANLLIDLQV